MCGRYASSRRPEDLVEEFEIDKVEVKEPLAPDFNVAPTKQVYAVLERPPRDPSPEAGPANDDGPQRQLRSLRWGLVPFWAKDPAIGNKMINARMETVHEKPAYRKAFASRRCLLPADGYYEWYPTQQKTKAGKRRSSRSSSGPRTAACWPWPGSTRSGATRPATRTTRSGSCGAARS